MTTALSMFEMGDVGTIAQSKPALIAGFVMICVKLKKECARSFTSTVTISIGQVDRRLCPDLIFGCQAWPTIGDLSS